jgi:hypothetical protein
MQMVTHIERRAIVIYQMLLVYLIHKSIAAACVF